MSAELSFVVARDSIYIGGIVLIMLVLVFFITRSVTTSLTSLGLNLFVLAASFGFMGWTGLQLTPATSMVVFLLVPLTTAFVIHAHGYVERQQERDLIPVEARLPCLLAGVTTAIGFACTGLTPAPDVQSLAVMGVAGIAAGTFGIFFFVFPVLTRQEEVSFAVRFRVPTWPLARPSTGIMMLTVLAIVMVLGLSRLKIDYGPTDYLPMSNPARADFQTAGQWFGRMNLPLVIEADSVEHPDIWQAVKPLTEELNNAYPTGFQTAWFYDHLSEVTQAFSDGGDERMFPSTEDEFAQLLLWFDPEDLELYMDEDRERLILLFQLPFIGSADYLEFKQIVTDYLELHNIDGYFVGRVSSFFETGHRIGGDNLVGLAVGASGVFLILLWLFRSLRMALIGLFINALPVLSSLAILGLLGVSIDMGSSMVCAMAFGIVLDDSTHLLVRVQQLQRQGYDPATAVLRSVRELISPIMTTTLVVCLGFSVLFAAEMQPFQDFAILMLTTMFTALVADIAILPALVRQFVKDELILPAGVRS